MKLLDRYYKLHRDFVFNHLFWAVLLLKLGCGAIFSSYDSAELFPVARPRWRGGVDGLTQLLAACLLTETAPA